MKRRPDKVADLLMGAALADRHLDGRELDTVRTLLRRAMGRPSLPEWLVWRLDDFKPEHLDVTEAVAKLGLDSDDTKRKLLELIVAVHESDETWDLSEDAYLREVASALGLAAADYADLTVGELEIESIGRAVLPPPLPRS